MNPFRRLMLHPLSSIHNPLTRLALSIIQLAIIMVVVCALWEVASIPEIGIKK